MNLNVTVRTRRGIIVRAQISPATGESDLGSVALHVERTSPASRVFKVVCRIGSALKPFFVTWPWNGNTESTGPEGCTDAKLGIKRGVVIPWGELGHEQGVAGLRAGVMAGEVPYPVSRVYVALAEKRRIARVRAQEVGKRLDHAG